MTMFTMSGLTAIQTVTFVLAAVQILFGIITVAFNQLIFDTILAGQLVVKEGTKSYSAWVETSTPSHTKFYFFHMLNPEGFLQRGEKPRLEERGPYTFREVERKVNLVWHPDYTVSYRRKKYWYYQPTLSAGTLNDTVLTLNMPLVGTVHHARGSYLMEYTVNDLISTVEAKLFVNRTIRELMFDGYEDPLMDVAAAGMEDYDDWDEEEEEEQVEDPFSMSMDKFGWFYKRNGTTWADGELRMHTGQGDINRLGQIMSWDGSNRTKAFPGRCGQVEGSSDGLFAPGWLKQSDSISIWSTDSCRKLVFKRTQISQDQHGLLADRFQLWDDVFSNGTLCQSNSCYENNLPSGLQNVTNCKVPSPAFISRPHFYKADNYYQSQFESIPKPDPTQHESYILIEPRTAIPVQVQLALQVNIKLEPCKGIEHVFKNLSTIYFPVMWFQGTASVPEDVASLLKSLLDIPNILTTASYFGMVAGILGMSCIAVRVLCARKKKDRIISTCNHPNIVKTKIKTKEASVEEKDAKEASLEEKKTLRSEF